jgi:hypothetical protein
MDSIIVSKSFTIRYLAGLIINELNPPAVVQCFGAKLVILLDLLEIFVLDSN